MTAEQWARVKSPWHVLREDLLPGLEEMLAEELLDRDPEMGLPGDGAFRAFLAEVGDDVDDETICALVREGVE